MPDSLLLNLLFSATLPLMCASPPREVRVAHNMARRLLAEELGYDEYVRLRDRAEQKERWDRIPGLDSMLSMGRAIIGAYRVLLGAGAR